MPDLPVSAPVFPEYRDDIDWIYAANQNVPNEELEALIAMVGVLGVAQSKSVDLIEMLRSSIPSLNPLRIEFADVDEITVKAGIWPLANSGGSQRVFRKNTADASLTAADLDTGSSFANSTDYYVYAIGDAVATTFTFEISTNASTPGSNPTIFTLIGGFSTNGSGEIIESTVWSKAGLRVLQVQYAAQTELVSGTAAIPQDDTVPDIGEGFEVVDIDVFVTSATSRLIILVPVLYSAPGASDVCIALFKVGTSPAIKASHGGYIGTNESNFGLLMHSFVPGAAGKIEFQVNIGRESTGSLYVNATNGSAARIFGGVAGTGILVIEVDK